jgi:hypothetical protein
MAKTQKVKETVAQIPSAAPNLAIELGNLGIIRAVVMVLPKILVV